MKIVKKNSLLKFAGNIFSSILASFFYNNFLFRESFFSNDSFDWFSNILLIPVIMMISWLVFPVFSTIIFLLIIKKNWNEERDIIEQKVNIFSIVCTVLFVISLSVIIYHCKYYFLYHLPI